MSNPNKSPALQIEQATEIATGIHALGVKTLTVEAVRTTCHCLRRRIWLIASAEGVEPIDQVDAAQLATAEVCCGGYVETTRPMKLLAADEAVNQIRGLAELHSRLVMESPWEVPDPIILLETMRRPADDQAGQGGDRDET